MDVGLEIEKLKPKAKRRFKNTLWDSIMLLQQSVMLRGPYRLVVDSNVLMRIEGYNNGEIKEGLLATILFFKFLKKLPYHIDVVVRPTVFYEYLRKRNTESTKEHWEKFKEIKNLIEEQFGLVLFFDGIETFSEANDYIRKIKNDELKIIRTLHEYEERDWKFNFIREGGGFAGFVREEGMIEVPPLFAAEGLYEKQKFEYFHDDSLRRFFIEHMAKKISECRENDQHIIQKYDDGYTYLLSKLLHMSRRGELLGLGDADIFTICNLQSQFTMQAHGRYFPASIALTLDGGLLKALFHFSSLHMSSGEIKGGEENWEDSGAKIEAFDHDRRRFAEGEERAKNTMVIIMNYLSELDNGDFSR